jgi:hypothetical protein
MANQIGPAQHDLGFALRTCRRPIVGATQGISQRRPLAATMRRLARGCPQELPDIADRLRIEVARDEPAAVAPRVVGSVIHAAGAVDARGLAV